MRLSVVGVALSIITYSLHNIFANITGGVMGPLISDNTAGVVTRRAGFQRLQQKVYLVPVVVEDSGYPIQSSTGTVMVQVCTCNTDGSLSSCNAEAVFFPMGLSTGALMAILLCIVILLGELGTISSFAHIGD